MNWRIALLLLLISTGLSAVISHRCVEGQTARRHYDTYANARFAYSISYPADLLLPQGEADNGDGQKFLSKDGRTSMLVFGSHNALNRTIRQLFDAESGTARDGSPKRVITYSVLKGNWFVVSGREDGRIFYRKTILTDHVIKTFIVEYPESEAGVWNSIVAEMARSFKG